VLLAALALVTSSSLGGEKAEPTRHPLIIRPAPKAEWKADLENVEAVLRSAAGELWAYFPGRSLKPILVEPKGGPIVLFGRGPDGEFRIRLDAGETYWSQYAFQFAHEFCHILCNYIEDDTSNKWFEESLCEMASLFALRRMAETWKTRPPYPNWKSNAPSLRKYADNRMAEAKLPADTTLAEWCKRNEAELRKDPCLRAKNRVVAGALLPLFERSPEHWEAVACLNPGKPPGRLSFQQYLEAWHKRCPAKHRAFVREIAKQFGVHIPAE
jgi:hypothetical protein